MQVEINFSDGSSLTVHDFDDDTALDLTNDLAENIRQPRFITFEVDGNTVLVNTAHIMRIEFI